MTTPSLPTESFPLQWPAGQPRTRKHAKSRFAYHSIEQSVKLIHRELKRMKAAKIVISSSVPLRIDGHPRSRTQPVHGEVGVAVYWTLTHDGRERPYVWHCDRWNCVEDNFYAVARSLEVLRSVDRWGAVQIEQAFAGFLALPPGPTTERHWRDVFSDEGPLPELPNDELLAIVKARYRRLVKDAHPDGLNGNGVRRAQELTIAWEAAERELRAQAP